LDSTHRSGAGAAELPIGHSPIGHPVRLNEDEFWKQLEFRVSEEFAGMAEARLRYLWCDGFVPDDYRLEGGMPEVRGMAWIGGRQEVWEFTLRMPRAITDPESLDWSTLLPPEDVTGWLAPDPARQVLIIEPGAAADAGT
jgi:hypothetical protein